MALFYPSSRDFIGPLLLDLSKLEQYSQASGQGLNFFIQVWFNDAKINNEPKAVSLSSFPRVTEVPGADWARLPVSSYYWATNLKILNSLSQTSERARLRPRGPLAGGVSPGRPRAGGGR